MAKIKRPKPTLLEGLEDGITSGLKNPFTSASKHITMPTKIKYRSRIANTRLNTIRFALISLTRLDGDMQEDTILNEPMGTQRRPLPIKNTWGLDSSACRRHIQINRHKKAYEYWKLYKSAIEKALNKDSKVVCINELGVPADIRGPLPAFFKGVKELAEKYSAVIITGSFHDTRTRYNTGYVFYPDCPASGEAFHKQVSATQKEIGEYINIPPKRESIVIKAYKLYISVITCLDLMDYSIISSLVQVGDKVDFIFVPACSPKIEPLEEVASVASKTLPGGVGIVNTYSKGRKNHSCLYLFDDNNPKLPDDSDNLDDNGIINYYDIPTQSFDDRKRDLQDTTTDYHWLLKNPRLDLA